MNLTNLVTNPDTLYTLEGMYLAGTFLHQNHESAVLIRITLGGSAAEKLTPASLHLLLTLIIESNPAKGMRFEPNYFAYLAAIERIFIQEDTLVIKFWEMVLASLSHEHDTQTSPNPELRPFLNYIFQTHQYNAPILLALYELSPIDDRAVDIITAINHLCHVYGVILLHENECKVMPGYLFTLELAEWKRHPHLSQNGNIYYGKHDNQLSMLRVLHFRSIESFEPLKQKVERRLDWIKMAIHQLSEGMAWLDLSLLDGKSIQIVSKCSSNRSATYRINISEGKLIVRVVQNWKYGTYSYSKEISTDYQILMETFHAPISPIICYSIAEHLALLWACQLLNQTTASEIIVDPFAIIPDSSTV